MNITRHFTTTSHHPYTDITFCTRSSEIRNPDGTIVFRADNVEVPDFWSQTATDILTQKYFRKAGVPAALKATPDPDEDDTPKWLLPCVADDDALAKLPEAERYTGETSAGQVFNRLAGA